MNTDEMEEDKMTALDGRLDDESVKVAEPAPDAPAPAIKALDDLLGSDSDEEVDAPAPVVKAVDERLGSDIDGEVNTSAPAVKAIDDLLGSDSDEEVKAPPPTVKAVDELLGSDSEEEEDMETKLFKEPRKNLDDGEVDEELAAEMAEEKEQDRLEFLGKLDESKSEKERVHTKSHLQLHDSFRIGEGQKSYFVRTPKFLKIGTIPYNPDTYDAGRLF